VTNQPCPTCEGPTRETTDMICKTCLTSYAPDSWPWWTISGDELMKMLYRVQRGDDPGVVYLEAYVNSDREDYRREP
jgi:hypothetical protein